MNAFRLYQRLYLFYLRLFTVSVSAVSTSWALFGGQGVGVLNYFALSVCKT